MQKNDIQVLKGLSKLLGKTDIQGQISEIELTNNFLDIQLEEAKKALEKNEKLYKNLGVITGLAIVIILV
jgi:stage III sporulation protein AB